MTAVNQIRGGFVGDGRAAYTPFPNYEETVEGAAATTRVTYSLVGQATAVRRKRRPGLGGVGWGRTSNRRGNLAGNGRIDAHDRIDRMEDGRVAYTPFPNYEETVEGAAATSRVTYSLAGQATAVRVTGDPDLANNGLFYLYNDHLGSAGAMQISDGSQPPLVTQYTPFGGYRAGSGGNGVTDRGFTGHKQNDDLGLIYMNARYYVSGIGRFASADTLVPNSASPQSHNRYAYGYNNPVKYLDPDGHYPVLPLPPINLEPVEKLVDFVTVQAFKIGYDQDLPKQFIDHYAYGGGSPVHLTESEMTELGVRIDLGARAEFNEQIIQIADNGGGTAHVSFSTFEAATTHGTLGNFTANYEGDLTVTVNESGNVTGWSFEGTVNFVDE